MPLPSRSVDHGPCFWNHYSQQLIYSLISPFRTSYCQNIITGDSVLARSAMQGWCSSRFLRPITEATKPELLSSSARSRITSYNVCYTKLLRTQRMILINQSFYIVKPLVNISNIFLGWNVQAMEKHFNKVLQIVAEFCGFHVSILLEPNVLPCLEKSPVDSVQRLILN